MNRTERITITILLTLCVLSSLLILLVLALPFLRGAVPEIPVRQQEAFLDSLLLRIVITVLRALVLLGSGASISLLIRKSNYPEFTFYIFGLLSYAGISLFHAAPLVIIGGGDTPTAAALLRLFYFFWIFGTMCLFIAGLFPNGIPNQKQLLLFFTALAGSVSVVLLIPVNAHHLLEEFPYSTSWGGLLPLFIRGFALLAVCNFLAAGIRSSSLRFFGAALGMFLALAGNELVFSIQLSAAVLSLGLFVGGTVLFAFMMYREYMWS